MMMIPPYRIDLDLRGKRSREETSEIDISLQHNPSSSSSSFSYSSEDEYSTSAKHQRTLQDIFPVIVTPASLTVEIVNTQDSPFPKYAQFNRPIRPAPKVQLNTDVSTNSLSVSASIMSTDVNMTFGSLAQASDIPQQYCWQHFVIMGREMKKKGKRVHPGQDITLRFSVTRLPYILDSEMAHCTASIQLYEHSKWFPAPEILFIPNPVTIVGVSREFHVYGQWFLSGNDNALGKLSVSLLDMEGEESIPIRLNPLSNHHFSFTHCFSKPGYFWVQIQNRFKHRSTIKIVPSPKRTKHSSIVVMSSPKEEEPRAISPLVPSCSSSSRSRQSFSEQQVQMPESFTAPIRTSDYATESSPLMMIWKLADVHHHHPAAPFFSPLQLAFQLGDPAYLRDYLNTQQFDLSELRCADELGMTCLHHIGFMQNQRQSQLFFELFESFEKNLDCYHDSAAFISPLHAAVLSRNDYLFDILWTRLSPEKLSTMILKKVDGKTLLHLAVIGGAHRIVRQLIPLSDVEAEDFNGETALFLAAKQNDQGIASELILAGASLDTINNANETIFEVSQTTTHLLFHTFRASMQLSSLLKSALTCTIELSDPEMYRLGCKKTSRCLTRIRTDQNNLIKYIVAAY